METHLQRLLIACNFICGLPAEVEEPEDMTVILPYLAIPAALLAIATLLITVFCGHAMPQMGGMVIGAVVIGVLWLLVSRGQNLLAMSQLAGALDRGWRGSPGEQVASVPQLVIFGTILFKLAALAVLVYQRQWQWLALVPLASIFYALEMSAQLGYLGSGDERLQSSRMTAGSLFLALSLVAGLPGLVFMAVLWMLCRTLSGWARDREPELWQPLVNGGSEATECLFLLLGLIFMS